MDPSGHRQVTDEEMEYLILIRDRIAEFVAMGCGTDVEALAFLDVVPIVVGGLNGYSSSHSLRYL